MEFKQIQYFIAVAESQSFSKAAQRAFVSQQAISKAIIALEKELGVPLFNRHYYGVTLTVFGQAFIKRSYHIIDILTQATNELSNLKQHTETTVQLAFTDGLEHDFPMEKILKFQKENPNCSIYTTAVNDKTLEAGLASGKFDVGLMGALGNSPQLEYTLLHQHPTYLVINKSNPLSQKETVRIEDLKNENFLFSGSDFWANTRLLAACNLAGFTPRLTHQTISMSYLCELIEANQGIFFSPQRLDAMEDYPNIVFIPIENDPLIFGMYIATKRDAELGIGCQLFIQYVKNLFSKQ